MTLVSVAKSQTSKFVKLTLSLLRNSFNSSKCKTAAKMTVARIKLLRNKRQAVVKQMRRDIALLLQSGQDATARIRVEHVIREQNILAANEFIELFCELIVARLQMIAKQRACPADLKEGIASVIFAAPRCSEIPELNALKDIFEKKYGKDFVSAATDLRPSCGVNRMLIDKLSVRTPNGETKLKVMKEIAKEFQIDWDTKESEMELLKPPEEKINGPDKFVSATSIPVKPAGFQPPVTNNQISTGREKEAAYFEDTASAAEAAAECAKKAVAAAQAAAYLADKDMNRDAQGYHQSSGFFMPNKSPGDSYAPPSNDDRVHRRHSYNDPSAYTDPKYGYPESGERSPYIGSEDLLSTLKNDGTPSRRHSYNAPSTNSDIKFDESENDEEIQPRRNHHSSQVPSSYERRGSYPPVHPKLPDYDELSARFEALKYHRKSQD